MRPMTVILCLIFSLIAVTGASADEAGIKKLQRGLVNVATAPLEVPKQVRAYWIAGSQKTMHISAWIFCGFVKGLWMAPLRIGSGLWDIVTFPLNIPSNGATLLQPPYVFNDWPKREKGVVYKNLWD